MRLINFNPAMRSLAGLVAFLACAPSLFAHYCPVVDTSLSYDAPTLQLISQRAAANQPLIQAGDTLGVVLKATPYGGTIDGVGGYMTFYVPPGMQVVGAQYVRTDGTTNGTYYPINMKGQDGIAIGGLQAVNIPELAGLGLGPNILGISNAVVNSSGLELGTIAGVYGDTGIFYSTDPRTSFGSWTNNGGYYRNTSRTNGFTLVNDFNISIIPVTEYDGEQEIGYGMISPATAIICYPNSSHCEPWGLANDVAGPQSGYAWQFNWLTYSNVLQATGNRDLAMKSSVTNVGPWMRIKYPGSQISKDIPGNPSTVNGYVGIDASTMGYNLSAAPLPATTSWTDTTSTKAVRFSLGALYLGKPEYARVYLKVITPSECTPMWSDAFGGDAGGDQGGFSQLWRYYNPTVAELLPCASIQKVVNKAVNLPGSNVVFEISFVNSGNVPFTNFTISDAIPSGLTYLGASPAPTTISGSTLTWNYGTLPAYTNLNIYLTNKGSSSGTFFNTAVASSGTNVVGTGTDSVTFGSISDLTTYGKSVTPTSVLPGGSVTYTIGITNSGDAANGTPLVINETLPVGFAYQSLSSVQLNGAALSSSFYSVSASNPNAPIFSISSGINAGQTLFITFVAKSSATNTAGTYWNTYELNFENKTIGGVPMAPVVVGAASIGNYVFLDWNTNGIQDALEPGLVGVTVTASNTVTKYATTQVTATNGYYNFLGLSAGTYVVYVPAVGATGGAPSGYLATTNLSYTVTLTNNQVVTWANFGFLPRGTASIGTNVFNDINHNGVFDTGDIGIPNVTVHLYDAYSNQVYKTTTDANGYYIFSGLAPNLTYYVQVNANTSGLTNYFGGTDYLLTTKDPIYVTNLVGNNTTADFGYYKSTPNSIGQYVYLDANANGIYDAGDAPLAGVPVSLYLDTTNSSGVITSSNLLAQTTTSGTGQYFFNNLGGGDYTVVVSTNSTTVGLGSTPSFTTIGNIILTAGTTNYTVNFPFVIPPPVPPTLYKSVSPSGNTSAGATLTYSLLPNYTNNAALSSVTVTDGIPAGTTFASAGQGGTTTGHSTYVSWSLGSTTNTSGSTNLTSGTTAGAIAQRGAASTASQSSGNTLTISAPANVAAGDLLVANFSCLAGSAATPASLSGWTLVGYEDFEGSPGHHTQTVLYKVATAADVGASYDFTISTSTSGGMPPMGGQPNGHGVGEIIDFTNVSATGYTPTGGTGGPFDVAPGSFSYNTSGSTAVSATGITTATANAEVLMLVGGFDGTYTLTGFNTTSPGPLTALDATGGYSTGSGTVGTAGAIKATAGVTGSGSATFSGGKQWAAILLALRPANTSVTHATTTSLSVNHTLVTNGEPVTVTLTVTATGGGLPTTVTAGSLGVIGTGGASATFGAASPTSQSVSAGIPATFTYTSTAVTAGTTPGTLTFTAQPSDSVGNWMPATNTILITPALTFQATVATSTLNQITNVAYLQDTSGAIVSTPSPTVTNYLGTSIGFLVWADTNANGKLDAGESGLAGVTVYISATNGVADNNGPSAITDVYGHYQITGLATDIVYTVTYSNLPGYAATTPVSVNLTNTISGEYNTNANFGLNPPAYVNPSGASLGYLVYLDANNNNVYDTGDAPLANIPVYLYSNTVASGPIIATNYTSATGTYYFTNLPAGTYSVAVSTNSSSLPAGLLPEVSPYNDIVLISSQTNYTINFSFTNTPPPAAVIPELYKSVSPTTLTSVGATLTYNLLPNYTGTATLSSLTVTDGIPLGTTFASAAQGGTTNSHATYVSWALGSTTAANNGTKTLSNGSVASIALRATSAVGTTSSGSSLTITAPSGVQNGDVLIANISIRGGSTVNYPSLSGWTTVASVDFEGSGLHHRCAVLYHVYSSSDTTPYVFALNSGAITGANGAIVAYSGVDNTTPFDVTPGTYTTGSASPISSVASVSTVSANDAILMLVSSFESTTFSSFETNTGPLSTLYGTVSDGNAAVGAAWALKGATGATGAGSAAMSQSKQWAGILLALKPGTTTTYNYTTTTALSANHSLVTNGEAITVTMTVSATGSLGFPITVSPGTLTAVGTSGSASFGAASPSSAVLSSSGASATFTYTGTATAGSNPGVLTFTATPSDGNGTWATGTANTTIVTPALTFQATVASTLNQITNIAYIQDTSGNLPSTPSPVVTNAFTGSIGTTVYADLNGNGTQDTGEPGIANITVYISATNGVADNNGPSAVTDAYGHYLITGLQNGVAYTVAYKTNNLPAGYVPTTATTVSVTLTSPGQSYTGANFGLQPATPGVPTSSIGNTVWLDANNNGVVDNGEVGISNVIINLYLDVNGSGILNSNDFVIATTTTTTNGYYLFSGLGTNHYIVQVPTNNPALTNLVLVSGMTNPAAVNITVPGTVDTNVNFGYDYTGSIGTTVYYDNNDNNIYEPALGESGVTNATVELYQDTLGNGVFDASADVLLATAITSTNGTYAFTNLPAGTYFVITLNSSVQPYGCDGSCEADLLPTGPTSITGVGPIQTVVLTAGEQYTNANFGYIDRAGIAGTVFADLNNNGIDDNEPGISNVTVYLYSISNGVSTLVASTNTYANGNYYFNPNPGTYYLTYSQTDPNIPTYLTNNPTTPTTIYVTVLPGSEANGFNFGLGYDGEVGGQALGDYGTIGVKDAPDVGLSNVPVVLSVANGTSTPTPIAATVTGPNGYFLFGGLSNATYYVTVETNSLPSGYSPSPTYAPAGAGNPTATVVLPLGGVITNNYFGFPLNAMVSGVVYSGSTSNNPSLSLGNNPLPGIAVAIYTTGFAGSTTPLTLVTNTYTSGNGAYSFANLPPGNYVIIKTNAPGYINVADTTPPNDGLIPLTLSYGQNSTGNNFLASTTGSNLNIGGNVLDDTTDPGVIDIPGDTALAGVTVGLYVNVGGTGVVNPANLIATTLTGVNGSYVFTNIPGGNYIVQVTNPVGGPTVNVTTSQGQPTNTITVTLTTANSLNNNFLLGNVTLGAIGQYVFADVSGSGVYASSEGISNAMVFVDLNGTGVYAANDPSALTSSNGFYIITNLPMGSYTVVVATNTLPAGLTINSAYPSGGATNTGYATLSGSSPTNLLMNFGYLGTGAIGQRVFADLDNNGQYDAGEGLSGVSVTLTGNFTGSGVSTITNLTSGDGYYQFIGLRATNTLGIPYLVTVLTNTLPAGYTLNTVNPPGGANSSNTVTLTATVSTNQLQNFGYIGSSSLTGNVFVDVNQDGVFNGTDFHLAGVMVILSGSDSVGQAVSYTNVTTSGGNYVFNNLPPGYYTLTEIQPGAYGPGASIPGNQGGTSVNPNQISVTLPSNTAGTGYNFTAWPGAIGDYVWVDANGNGLQDSGEPGLAGITVTLYTTNSGSSTLTTVATTTSGSGGAYSFTGLATNTYVVGFSLPVGYNYTTPNVGSNPNLNSQAGANGLTPVIALNPGQTDNSVDAGYVPFFSLSGTVFDDTNGLTDGVVNGSVTNLNGALYVNLVNASGNVVTNVAVAANGTYVFTNVFSGSYTAQLTTNAGIAGSPMPATGLPAGWGNSGGSVAGVIAGNTNGLIPVSVASASVTAVNFGIWQLGTIGDYTWLDSNGNGLQDGSEPALAGVTEILYQSNTVTSAYFPVATNVSSSSGFYEFTNVPPGVYLVSFSLPAGSYSRSPQLVGSNPYINSAPSPTNGLTFFFTLAPGATNLTMNAGYTPSSTPVDVVSLTAVATANGVVVTWRTYDELDLLAFDVARSTAGGPAQDVTPDYVMAVGQDVGATYHVADAGATAPGVYTYTLYAIDDNLTVEDKGTVTVHVAAPVAPGSAPVITSLTISGGTAVLNWSGGQPPYVVEQTTSLGADAAWQPLGTAQTGTQLVVPLTNHAGFFRVDGAGN